MSDDNGEISAGTKALATVAAFGAAFVARKVLVLGWKKITGKEPPTDQDPAVGFGEALGWAVVVGVGIQAARMLATRAVTRKAQHPAGEIQQ